MFKAMKALYKCIRDFFTGFAVGWKGATHEWSSRNSSMIDPNIYRRIELEYYRCAHCNEFWPSGIECPCSPKIENHTPDRHHDSGLTFLFGILLGVAICGNDEDA